MCFVLWLNSGMPHTWVCFFFSFSCLSVCIISPTILLILYPTRLFRKCVSCCGFRRWHALHMFVESFQGQYKDGTNGTHDFRMFSALFLILRILVLLSLVVRCHHAWISLLIGCLFCVVASCFYATIRPYKSNLSNNGYLDVRFVGNAVIGISYWNNILWGTNFHIFCCGNIAAVRCSTHGTDMFWQRK